MRCLSPFVQPVIVVRIPGAEHKEVEERVVGDKGKQQFQYLGAKQKETKIKRTNKKRGGEEVRIHGYTYMHTRVPIPFFFFFVFKRIPHPFLSLPVSLSLFFFPFRTTFLHMPPRSGRKKGRGRKVNVGASVSMRERDSRSQRGVEILGSCQMAHCALEAHPSSF